ncbi:MAG TPA: ribosome small subunit-dependent GTPase A [Bryobacteraceae bacterium]|nr:ribosome small subunit-dependent GTPase A [Bryobacteraceae bacterium]
MQDCFDLTTIGATGAVSEAFIPYAAQGLVLGRVSVAHSDRYRIYTARGEMTAQAIGALLYRTERPDWPAVGDWVAVQPVGPEEAMIHAVLPRRTMFSRRAAGDREQEQVMAANIDRVWIVCGLDQDFNVRRIERYLTLAHASGAQAAVVLNKSDICADLGARMQETALVAGSAPVIAITARSPDCIDPLRHLVGPGVTIALLGSSGVGKSTLVNRLLGADRQLVREVRESDGRGRHTTTYRELLPLPHGGALIDTPGMRELQLWADQDSLDSTFAEIAALAAGCRFRDCSHAVEEGCAVQAAIAAGELQAARWQSYAKLRAEVAWHARQTDVQAAQALKRKWKVIHKAMRKDHKRDPGGAAM